MASRARSSRRLNSSTSRLTAQRYAIRGRGSQHLRALGVAGCAGDLPQERSRVGIDERLQLLAVRFVEVREKGQVVRTVDEPYRQHHVPLEETIGPYHNTDQRATVKQDIMDPAEPVTAVAEHDVLPAVNLDLAFPRVGNFVKCGQCDTTDSTGQDRLLFERCLPHGRRPGPIAEVERLTTDVGPRHRKSDEIMGGRNDGYDRDYNLVRDEERLGSTKPAGERLVFLHHQRARVE